MPYSKINKEIGRVLIAEGFLEEVKESNEGNKKYINATITYDNRRPRLNDIKIVSKPSLRVYSSSKTISDIEKRGKHIAVLTTSQGVMTGRDARKKGIGGEILFEIW